MLLYQTIWPDGSLSLYPRFWRTVDPQETTAKLECAAAKKLWAEKLAREGDEFASKFLGLSPLAISHNGIVSTLRDPGNLAKTLSCGDFEEISSGGGVGGSPPSGGLGVPPKSNREAPEGKFRKTRAPRGSRGMSKFGGKMTRSACQLLEEVAAGRAVGFLTLTLPQVAQDQLERANKNWSEIMRQFMQELTRELRRAKLPDIWVWVTEWQKRGALHAHIGFVASHQKQIRNPAQDYPISKDWYQQVWQRILKNVLGEDFDCKSATRIERVKQSTSAYFGKYISKNARLANSNPGQGNADINADMSADMGSSIADMSADMGSSIADINADMNADIVTVDRDGERWLVNSLTGEVLSACPDVCITGEVMHNGYAHEWITDKVLHPSSWYGASLKLRRAVKKRVETWTIKIESGLANPRCPQSQEWLIHAMRIIDKQETYWNRTVYSEGQIPRAIAGRLRLKPGWKEDALAAIFGKKLTRDYFRKTDAYWRWRVKRDGAIPEQHESGEAEWVQKQMKDCISFPYQISDSSHNEIPY